MIPRIEALNELTRLSQAAGMYDDPPKPRPTRYHLVNRCTHWEGDTIQMQWRVVTSTGRVMTRWLTYIGAESELGKLLHKQRASENV